MDMISGFRDDVKKAILNNVFQGVLILIPPIYAFAKSCDTGDIPPNTLELIKDFSTSIIIALVVLCLALGHLLLKVGHNIEEQMGNTYDAKAPAESYKLVWNQYKKTFFPKDKEPVLVRYYSNMMVGLRFELATLCAIPFVYIESIVIDQCIVSIIPSWAHCPILLGLSLLFLYLYIEAREGVKQLHLLRKEIVISFSIINPTHIHLMDPLNNV